MLGNSRRFVHVLRRVVTPSENTYKPVILTFTKLIVIMSGSAIVQYIVIRSDLLKELKWPVGAVIAQACHAAVAVTHMFYEDKITQDYLSDLDNMHKIVLEAKDENSLRTLGHRLEENSIKHKLWIEQPEDIPTCLVVKPYHKEEVQEYFKRLKLFKN